MILNSATSVVPWNPRRRRATTRRVMTMMRSSAQNLRVQLDQLHTEALLIRNKANNARLRLIRLSEAAEKLRRQAGISLQAGRENDARDLLYQKNKVLEAMDKSKARIQLLDDLSFKLNQAISAKETHLIQHVASDLDIVKNDASDTIRIVSPKDKDTNFNVDEILVKNAAEFNSNQELQTHEIQPSQPVFTSANDFTSDLAGNLQIESDTSTGLKGISSYEDFVAYIDEQLDKIEAELDTVLRVSTLVLEGDEKLKNLRVQQTLDILEGVRHIRERISKIMQKMTTRIIK